MVRAEAALKKAQAEMTALEDETVRALTGESTMDIAFLNSLIPKRKANLEGAQNEDVASAAKLQTWKRRTAQQITNWK